MTCPARRAGRVDRGNPGHPESRRAVSFSVFARSRHLPVGAMTPVTYPDFAHRCWRFLFRAGAAGIPQLSLDDISSGLGAGEARVRHAVQTLLTHELVDEAVVDG